MAEVRLKLWPTLLTGWKVWPFISFINFMFVPMPFQVAFINVVSIFWSTYMSYMKSNEQAVYLVEGNALMIVDEIEIHSKKHKTTDNL